MSTPAPERPDSRASLWDRLKAMLVQAVPEDIAICEFDCRKTQCTYGEWATCQRRIQYQAHCHAELAKAVQDGSDNMPPGSGSDLVQR
jgi:hypothetical protein